MSDAVWLRHHGSSEWHALRSYTLVGVVVTRCNIRWSPNDQLAVDTPPYDERCLRCSMRASQAVQHHHWDWEEIEMTNHDIDLIIMGASGGLLLGTWVGYKLRSLREGVGQRAVAPEWRRSAKSMPSFADGMQVERRLRRDAPTQPIQATAGREDVVSALVGAGYRKTVAASAVDACEAHERTSVESWTMAALRRASGRS